MNNYYRKCVYLQDENDNAPVFAIKKYSGTVNENATVGTFIVGVTATDNDGTLLNSGFLYRIDSGAQDKFRIDFNTGEISVEIGAKLDRETRDVYVLNVSANDRGQNPLVGYCEVTITVLDVNDRMPEFKSSEKTAHINEAATIGDNVTVYMATDVDINHNLVYSLLPELTRAYNENGTRTNVTVHNINVS